MKVDPERNRECKTGRRKIGIVREQPITSVTQIRSVKLDTHVKLLSQSGESTHHLLTTLDERILKREKIKDIETGIKDHVRQRISPNE
jgi:hypothetical protein